MNDDEFLALKNKVERLVFMAGGGKLSKEDLAQHDSDLRELGLDSLGYLNLLEGLERAFGVAIDLDEEDDHTFLHTVHNIASYVVEQTGRAAA